MKAEASCPHCHGLLRREDDGRTVCRICAREHNPPPVYPSPQWPNGVQPLPMAVKPHGSNPQAVFPPAPSHPWREESGAHWANTEAAQVTLAEKRRRGKAMAEGRQGKQRVAPVGGLGI